MFDSSLEGDPRKGFILQEHFVDSSQANCLNTILPYSESLTCRATIMGCYHTMCRLSWLGEGEHFTICLYTHIASLDGMLYISLISNFKFSTMIFQYLKKSNRTVLERSEPFYDEFTIRQRTPRWNDNSFKWSHRKWVSML